MEDVQRFSVELEFVQCLANPNYVNHLAQHGFLNRDDFVNYLKYLQYWRRPEYARFLKYPQCLHFLDLLQHEEYKKAMALQKNARFVEDQQILQWHHYIRKRLRLHDMITNQTAENNNQSSG